MAAVVVVMVVVVEGSLVLRVELEMVGGHLLLPWPNSSTWLQAKLKCSSVINGEKKYKLNKLKLDLKHFELFFLPLH